MHFPLFRGRWHCSTWTHEKLCWKPLKSNVMPDPDIIKDMRKELIIFVLYHHKCRSIFTLTKMLKAIKNRVSETGHTMGIWCLKYFLYKIKEILEGPNYDTSFHTIFRAAGSWTDMKRQQAFISLDACYHKQRASYWWGTSLQVMLSYIHTSSRVCYHLNCKSETLYEAAERLPYEQLLSNPHVFPMADTVLWLIICVLPWWMWSSLYVISPGTEKPLLYADNIAMVEFVEEVYSMRSELHQIKSVNSDDVNKATVVLG